jgi:hypothetical protein
LDADAAAGFCAVVDSAGDEEQHHEDGDGEEKPVGQAARVSTIAASQRTKSAQFAGFQLTTGAKAVPPSAKES